MDCTHSPSSEFNLTLTRPTTYSMYCKSLPHIPSPSWHLPSPLPPQPAYLHPFTVHVEKDVLLRTVEELA